MKLGKILIFMAVLASIAIQGAELELKEKAAKLNEIIAELKEKKARAEKALEIITQKNLDIKLLTAVEGGNSDKVRALLEQKANPNYTNLSGSDLLARAIWDMDICVLRERIDEARSYLNIIHLLLASGANPNGRAFNKCISCISTYDSYDVDVTLFYKALALFLEYGADDALVDTKGKTIHDHAETNPELQRILNEHVQKAKTKIAEACPMFPMAIVHLCGDKLQVTGHDRALYRAVEMGAAREVEALLIKNADPHVAFDVYGQKNPVLYKAFDHWGSQHFRSAPLVALLLQAKADPNCGRRFLVNDIDFKPLDSVAATLETVKKCRGKKECADVLECAELLLAHKSNVNAGNGNTLIAKATTHGHPELVALYLKYGADTDKEFQKQAQDKPEIMHVCEEHRKQCAERIAEIAPEFTRAQDFRGQEFDITERIAGYII